MPRTLLRVTHACGHRVTIIRKSWGKEREAAIRRQAARTGCGQCFYDDTALSHYNTTPASPIDHAGRPFTEEQTHLPGGGLRRGRLPGND